MIELTKEKEELLLGQMKDVFVQNEYYVKVDEESLQTYLKLWKENKAHIYDLFSKRTEWNADELCLVVKSKTKREANKDKALSLIKKVLEKMPECAIKTTYYFRAFECMVKYDQSDVLNWEPDYSSSSFNDPHRREQAIEGHYASNLTYSYWYHQAKLRKGQKHSKVVLKLLDVICQHFKFDYTKAIYTLDETCKIRLKDGGFTESYEHNWEQLKAKMCDALLPLEVDETFYISLNPLDYLTMSHGDCWESCHSLRGDGCYHSATVTMLADPSTIIIYTLSEKNPKEHFYSYDKQTRQICNISKDLDGIFQQVFYPSKTTNDADVIKEYLQQIISEYKEASVKWVKSSYKNEIINYDEYLGYTDWMSGKSSVLTKMSGSAPTFKIGKSVPWLDDPSHNVTSTSRISRHTWVICSGCGNYHKRDDCYTYDDEYYCKACYHEKFIVCQECDHRIPQDEVVLIDGKRYCKRCAKKINYKTVEDGTNRTDYVTYVGEEVKEYFSSVEALKQVHPTANYCETDKVCYNATKCPVCVEKEKFAKKKQIVIDAINNLDSSSEFYQYKEQFLTILQENDLPDEIRELILKQGE